MTEKSYRYINISGSGTYREINNSGDHINNIEVNLPDPSNVTSDLSNVISEIQKILQELEMIYQVNTPKGKQKAGEEVIALIESNIGLKQRLMSACREGGISAIEAMLDHPLTSFVIAAIKDWKKS